MSFNNGLLVRGRIIIELIADALDIGYLQTWTLDIIPWKISIFNIEVSQEYGYEAEAHPLILVYRSI